MSDGDGLEWVEADNGAIVGLDEYDQVIQAYDPATGADLDPDDYAVTEPDPFAERDERLDRLEALASQPRQYEQVIDEINEARVTDDLTQQRARMEAPEMFGRPLLLREQQAYATRASDHVLAGDARPDLVRAAAELHDEGTMPLLDLDDPHRGRAHQARTEWMAARLDDQARYADADAGYDDLSSAERPASQGAYDLDNRAERQAYYADRLRGAVGADAGYSGSDLKEPWES